MPTGCIHVRFEVLTRWPWTMASSGMLRRVALVRTDVSEELSASISFRRLLVTANVPNSPILVTLMMEALSSSKSRFLQEPHGVTSQKTPFFGLYTCLRFRNCWFPFQLLLLKTNNSVVVSAQSNLSAKLVPTFVSRGVSRGERNRSQRPLISVF
jgi:hypothetical protein